MEDLEIPEIPSEELLGAMLECSEIPKISDEKLSDKEKFYDFCEKTFGFSSEEKDKTLTKFCDRQIRIVLENNDKRKGGYGAELDNLRRFLDKDKKFLKELYLVREGLELDKIKHSQKTYKDIEEASDDLLYQLWLTWGSKGDFEKDILEKIEKVNSGALSESDTKFIYRYTGAVNHSTDYILKKFCLSGGWREYVLAKIASPDKKQSNISFRRILDDDFPIKVDRVCGDCITITIRPGFRASYGRIIHNAFKPILAQLTVAETKDDEVLIWRPLYVDKESPEHTTVSGMVKWLYPESDTDTEIDRIKKLYKKD
ncbi:hypothetical protein IJ076_03085 [Candidatus Saccharibacteria bacterium]|nr:hypothetical protein [Candidatus Saccharibacteria bacterium]